jgi:uncharacterized repeat protein (TIGR03803 family)
MTNPTPHSTLIFQSVRCMVVALALVSALTFILPLGAQAQTLQTLYIFSQSTLAGTNPIAQLVRDSQGNIYGVTEMGGLYRRGTIYEFTAQGGLKVLHNINPEQDGISPSAPLIIDTYGNLYTTLSGGFGTDGTVIQLAPNANGTWTESTLHVFTGPDGSTPSSAPLLQANILYGTTPFGGTNNYGVAYSVSNASPRHLFNVIHTFDSTSGMPSGALIADAHGNFYGMTDYSSNHFGRVYELSPQPGGTWSYTVLYSFQGGTDGNTPSGSLIFDAAGNLYGVTTFGGTSTLGTVFKLSPNLNGTWSESVLYSFPGGMGGAEPDGPLTLGPDGSLYGTTPGASAPSFIYQLTPALSGQWTYSNLADFNNPYLFGGLVPDSAGNLYGIYNGSQAEIFKLIP